ncbi:atrial natriuretic peptide receptor 3-like [Patiria miniata]|uniref:Receptor ligand binding region domain-containing protein n=1 Tax=Patiria miniata TaxID=46514 RepID=A0A913Z4I6_PATMI|nr:atrial natriuretic peptide receptor 3-like [Patiria miniata]
MLVGTAVLLSLPAPVHLIRQCQPHDKEQDSLLTSLTMSVLLPGYPVPRLPPNRYYPFFMQMVRPATDMALQRYSEILPNHNVTVLYGNTLCESGIALNTALVDWLDHGADVFIGPACEYTASQVSRFLGFRNVPMVTGAAMAMGFRRDGDHPTITRTQAPYNKMGEAVRDFFVQFAWNHTVMVYRKEDVPISDCKFAMGSIYRVLLEHGFQTTHGDFEEVIFKDRDYITMLEEEVMPKARSKLLLPLSQSPRLLFLLFLF